MLFSMLLMLWWCEGKGVAGPGASRRRGRRRRRRRRRRRKVYSKLTQ